MILWKSFAMLFDANEMAVKQSSLKDCLISTSSSLAIILCYGFLVFIYLFILEKLWGHWTDCWCAETCMENSCEKSVFLSTPKAALWEKCRLIHRLGAQNISEHLAQNDVSYSNVFHYKQFSLTPILFFSSSPFKALFSF